MYWQVPKFRLARSEPLVSDPQLYIKRGNSLRSLTNYFMPSTPRHTSIWNTTTTIIVMRGNFNNVQGDLRHLDRSTTFTSTASTASGPFNVEPESTVTRQSPQPTIMVVGGNFNNVQGNFRHLDRSTTTSTASTDPFNVEPASESTVTPQSSLSTTSPGKFFLFSFEVSRAMIYNDQHQCHQLSRYLPIPLLSILIMIQTDPQALQVILIIKKQV